MLLNFSTQFVELAKFDAKLGNSDIQANGKIENFMQYIFKEDLIKGHFAVNSSLMDLNQLMGSSATETTAAGSATAAPTETAAASVMEVPGNIDFVLDSKVAKVLYTNLIIENLAGNIIVRERK